MNEITIYDVAKRAGVAISTVSKVLSGRHAVSEKTRQRVLRVAEELNYIPSLAARSLAGERTNLIGVVISHVPHDLFADPMLLQVLYGIDAEATECDYALLLSTSRSIDDRMSAFERLLRGFRVDGVLIESGLGEDGVMLLAESGYPCVVIGYSQNNLPCVYPDDYNGTRLMTRHLLQLGHGSIGAITGPDYNRRAMLARLDGFRDELTAQEIPLADELVIPGDFSSESGYEGAARLMSLANPPTAIFAFNDRMAFGAIRWLREHGYRIPDDVSVAGFDDIAEAAQFDPPLTTIRMHPKEIGARATQMLFDLIARVDTSARGTEIVMPVEFIERQSTAQVSVVE